MGSSFLSFLGFVVCSCTCCVSTPARDQSSFGNILSNSPPDTQPFFFFLLPPTHRFGVIAKWLYKKPNRADLHVCVYYTGGSVFPCQWRRRRQTGAAELADIISIRPGTDDNNRTEPNSPEIGWESKKTSRRHIIREMRWRQVALLPH